MIFWIILFLVIYFAISSVLKKNKASALELAKAKVERHRVCPECAENIKIEAKKCRYCGFSLMPCSEEELKTIEENYLNELNKFEYVNKKRPTNNIYKNEDAWK